MAICRALESYNQYLSVVVAFVVGVLLLVRTYALYEQSRRVLALLVCCAVAGTTVACWSLVHGQAIDVATEYFFPLGCLSPMSQTLALRYAAAWGGLLAFDTLVFGLTIYKTLVQHRRAVGSSLFTLILRDGAIYFGVMVTLNTANILILVYGGPLTRGDLTMFTNISASVMITRLMLNLRDPSFTTMSQRSRISALDFHCSQVLSTLADSGGEMEPMDVVGRKS